MKPAKRRQSGRVSISQQSTNSENAINVICRFRPSTKVNTNTSTIKAFDVDSDTNTVVYSTDYSDKKVFSFDKVLFVLLQVFCFHTYIVNS